MYTESGHVRVNGIVYRSHRKRETWMCVFSLKLHNLLPCGKSCTETAYSEIFHWWALHAYLYSLTIMWEHKWHSANKQRTYIMYKRTGDDNFTTCGILGLYNRKCILYIKRQSKSGDGMIRWRWRRRRITRKVNCEGVVIITTTIWKGECCFVTGNNFVEDLTR